MYNDSQRFAPCALHCHASYTPSYAGTDLCVYLHMTSSECNAHFLGF